MAYTIVITIPQIQWSRRKVDMMRGDILRFFAQQGAPQARFEVREGGSAAEPGEEKLFIHLKCSPCGYEFYRDRFEPCPKCEEKANVHKATIKRVRLPDGIKPPIAPTPLV